jgi:hypothetical protein
MRQRTTPLRTFPLGLSALLLAMLLGSNGAGASELVTLCHVAPDGEPPIPQEIVVTEGALAAHLKNHPDDQIGTCQARCETVGACDDGNPCKVDACNLDGSCDNSQPVDCDDGEVCTLDACDPQSGCVNPPVPDGDQLACDDGNACSETDVCVAGACTGTPISGCCTSDADCPVSDACATRYCEDVTSTCKEVDLSGQCTAGACEVAVCDPVTGCGTAPVTCPDDGDICTIEQCNPFICGDAGACETLPNPSPPEPGVEITCDDGLDNDCDGLVDSADSDCPTGCPCWTLADVQQSSETSCETVTEFLEHPAGGFGFVDITRSLPLEFFRVVHPEGLPPTCEDPNFPGDVQEISAGEKLICTQILEDVLGPCEAP